MSNAVLTKNPPGLHARLDAFISSSQVQNFILALIFLNAITLGLETSPVIMATYGSLLHTVDAVILGVFLAEVLVRLYVHRLAFFRDPWSIFDFIVVGIALIPATGPFSVLRALRVLRVLRVLTIVPSMRRVVGALLGAIPGLISIALVLLLVYYVCAVIATNLFSAAFPEWFGNIGRSLYTLFQVMTLESWSMGISRPVMEEFPYAWVFFIPFILVATFTMLNLFIAVIVGAMQTVANQEQQDAEKTDVRTRSDTESVVQGELIALRLEIQSLRTLLTTPQPPSENNR